GHWAEEAVGDMGSRMVVNGTGSGKFDPDRSVTRAEFAAIVVCGLGLPKEGGSSRFPDVGGGDWKGGVISAAVEYGLIDGFEDGTFRPDEQITREQAMMIVSKAMAITGLALDRADARAAAGVIDTFTDAAQ